jgi:peptidoglycan-associated lipoprotein
MRINMNACMTRILFFACIIASLSLFTGCGPKPVEPYTQKTGTTVPTGDASDTYFDYGYTDDPVTGYDIAGDHSDISNLLDYLPGGQDASARGRGERGQDAASASTSGPLVEPLDAGSRADVRGLSSFSSDPSTTRSEAEKRTHGRSSAQMLSVYYDFDQSSIRRDQISKMENNSAYLKKNPRATVVIEGNCDERGTKEYNLALGERRAMSAKRYLISLGIPASRIRTVSYGAERPLFFGTEEADYSLNRRADFVLE